ncbi:hypothetical protein [Pseudoxanthomonas mexicana]|uniref:hypothetical protein n=1 Tax=Pseudoxanthomonas mexicana TaxID=128785 RepID=UPI0024E250EB|nr:hypothetical protein [Pseudoxanthomonas mexicana]
MSRLSVFALLATVVALPAAHARERTHYLYLVNRAHDAIVSVTASPVDAEDGRELLAGARLAGGGEAVTVQLDSDACVHDLHIAFANGRRALYPAFDLCRQRGLRVMPLPARSREERLASGAARVQGETAGSD